MLKIPKTKLGSVPFVPPSLVGAYYLPTPDTRATFFYNNLPSSDTCSVTAGHIAYRGGAQIEIQNCIL